ncbi:MAG: D-alanyl-D-alanine carboxypeptidase [Chlamydiales bacterium]|nr:D-alanyl-D-alanine carboxypeptidase [Chlamydiales bacterium]
MLKIAALLLLYPFLAFSAFQLDLSAQSAILIDQETGLVLYEKNAHLPLHPASTTKVITALYALERKGDCLDVPVMASADSVAAVHPHIRREPRHRHPPYRLEFGGTHAGIKTGEVLSFRDLLYALMLPSGNDAANVIGEYVSGSVGNFMEELNAFVRGKGLKGTTLFTPHGLPHPDHKTTAYDMAQLARLALQYPIFREVVSSIDRIRPQTNKQPEAVWRQGNALVRPGKFHYPKATGIKTGYTTSSGYTLVASAEDENRKLIVALLGCERIERRYEDAIALFEAAFKEPKIERVLFSKEFDKFSCPVQGGKRPLQASMGSDLILSYYASQEPPFQTVVEWEVQKLPIPPGQSVGSICVKTPQGNVLARTPLFSIQSVEPTWGYQIESICRKAQLLLQKNIRWILSILGLALIGSSLYLFQIRKKVKKLL